MSSSSTAEEPPLLPPLPTTPILVLPRLIVRPFDPSDAPHSARHANDPDIARYMRNTFPHPYGLSHARDFIADIALKPARLRTAASPAEPVDVLVCYALCRRADGAFVGTIGLKPLQDCEERTAEIGYWIAREHWRQGYASEAVGAFTEWCFQTFPWLLKMEGAVYEGNVGSEGVLRRAGYQAEGVRRKAIWKWGKSLDLVYYGMLRDECLAPEPKKC